MTPFGPYSLLRKIATGGTAEIYLARRHGVDGFARHLAIKRILPNLESEPQFVQLLLDEARLAAHLHHGHIIPIDEVGVENGQAYIAMEFLPGTDLGRLMRAARRRQRRVLVVARDQATREALGRALSGRLGVEVLSASDRETALTHSAEGPVDLALVESAMLGPIRDPLMHALQAQHPELMRVILLGATTGRRAGCYALATERVDAALVTSLAQQCLAAAMPLELTIQVVRAVAEALDYAHTATDFAGHPLKIVHRDVNPSNILVSLGGVVKLVDFGIARASVRAQNEGRGNFVGTVNYMCPEQATGEEPDSRGDQFSLGTVFYELVTGRHPFSGDNEFQTLRHVRERRPQPMAAVVPGVPDAFSTHCARAMEKRADARHPMMADFLAAIEDTVRREGLNLSPKRMARFLEVVYSEQERAGFGLATTGYELPVNPTPRAQFSGLGSSGATARVPTPLPVTTAPPAPLPPLPVRDLTKPPPPPPRDPTKPPPPPSRGSAAPSGSAAPLEGATSGSASTKPPPPPRGSVAPLDRGASLTKPPPPPSLAQRAAALAALPDHTPGGSQPQRDRIEVEVDLDDLDDMDASNETTSPAAGPPPSPRGAVRRSDGQ